LKLFLFLLHLYYYNYVNAADFGGVAFFTGRILLLRGNADIFVCGKPPQYVPK
jgi:hypothetical protein